MPSRNRTRSMRGGFLDGLKSTLSNWSSSLSNMWSKKSNDYNSNAYQSSNSVPQQSTSSMSYGGRSRRRHRRYKGGASIADHASPISGISTAKPHTLVGGRRRHKRNKTHKKH